MRQLIWNGDKILKMIEENLDDAARTVADKVLKDAKMILRQKADKLTADGLLSQMDVRKSRFGGYLVRCQGAGSWKPPWHVSFVEFGTRFQEAKPFMRPALRKNKQLAKKTFGEALSK